MRKDVYTKEDILRQLDEMNVPRDGVVLVHSSLRLVGNIEGKVFLDALIEHCTAAGGLLCIPTHTWGFLRREITLDMTASETCLGALSNVAAADPRGIRSENPTHSMVVFGDRARAEKFVENELFVTSGTSSESCYGKIYREGGHILLLGVSHSRNTYLHCVEEMLDVPNRLTAEPREVCVRLASGEIVKRKIKTHHTDYTKDVSLRFVKYEMPFRYHGAIRDGFIGHAPTQLCDARIMKETLELILKNSGGADPLVDEKPILPTLYR